MIEKGYSDIMTENNNTRKPSTGAATRQVMLKSYIEEDYSVKESY